MHTESGESATGLPALFEQLVRAQYGEHDAERIMEGCAKPRMTTLRANTLRATREEIATALDQMFIAWEPVSWYDDAFVLPVARTNELWNLTCYQAGAIYVQSLSSMIPALVLDPHAGEDILDACAAPGGKTTQMAALGGKQAHITACEMHAPRAEKLEHNLRKLGASNVTVMRTDARRLDEFFRFDRILVDAPCSGSGTLVANGLSAHRFTQALIDKSRKSQRALLDKALTLLKPGGTLVYSTCSVLACENEEIVQEALEAANRPRKKSAEPAMAFRVEPIDLAATADLPVLPTAIEGTLALCPTERYEGFFIAKIKRTA